MSPAARRSTAIPRSDDRGRVKTLGSAGPSHPARGSLVRPQIQKFQGRPMWHGILVAERAE